MIRSKVQYQKKISNWKLNGKKKEKPLIQLDISNMLLFIPKIITIHLCMRFTFLTCAAVFF